MKRAENMIPIFVSGPNTRASCASTLVPAPRSLHVEVSLALGSAKPPCENVSEWLEPVVE